MTIKEMNYIIGESLEEYSEFRLFDHTNNEYIGTFDDADTAVMVANTINPYGCKRIDVEAAYDHIDGSLPFYLRDIENNYTKLSARIALFEVYDDARERYNRNPSLSFEDILETEMENYG